jgi:hypothetical protein
MNNLLCNGQHLTYSIELAAQVFSEISLHPNNLVFSFTLQKGVR